MTPAQFRTNREALGLSQADLAAIWDYSQRTISRWETAEKPIPQWAKRLIVYEGGETPG